MKDKKTISFILPVYNESQCIDKFFKELNKSIMDLESKYEFTFFFVNDGSRDDSLEKLIKLHESDDRIVIINFSRNFGHQIAITAGIDYSVSDAAIIMDTDLQDPPEVVLELIEKWEENFEVVYAQRRKRKDSFFKNVTAHLFYRILNYFAEINIPLDTGDFRLIDKKVIEAIKQFREQNRFMRGLFSYIGYKQTAVYFDRNERYAGKTNYPFKKMLRLALDGITSFSTVPLNLISQLGFGVSFLSFIGILYALFMKLFFPDITVSGWTLIIISILFIGGIQLMTLGIIGTYVGKIYREVQDRPLYLISSIHESK